MGKKQGSNEGLEDGYDYGGKQLSDLKDAQCRLGKAKKDECILKQKLVLKRKEYDGLKKMPENSNFEVLLDLTIEGALQDTSDSVRRLAAAYDDAMPRLLGDLKRLRSIIFKQHEITRREQFKVDRAEKAAGWPDPSNEIERKLL